MLKSVPDKKFFLCDFPFLIRQNKRLLQHFMLVKNKAQHEIPN
ncbi:hypothetical protein Ent8706_13410 [Enterobacter kobei]|nr:hypothetical protein ECNIH4_09615 [Enterobacter cloacae]KJI57106.1 hypothetical protein UO85_02585 [Enterobacter kobei]OWS65105.1 hypothetical protein WM88_19035 [Enterobacter cloacae complex sp. ECNIH6]KRS27239.1 hypothetical protein Ent8706_13410 [Enterobacter kobei]KUQ02359.1 hypothetical protein AWI05_00860 [Enterobacter kobei]